MEPAPASHDGDAAGDDAEINSMREELIEFGLNEEDLSREEMSDLLKALRSSRSSASEEELLRSKKSEIRCVVSPGVAGVSGVTTAPGSSHKLLRRYRAAADRRLPWCLLPPDLTYAQKVQCLSAYIKLLSINQYVRARSLSTFEEWSPALVLSAGGGGRGSAPARATRSGRCVPSYTTLLDDDDDADLFVARKPKKRKVSGSEVSAAGEPGVYANKTFSLKRKTQMADGGKIEMLSEVEECSELTVRRMETDNKTNRIEKTSVTACSLIDTICNSSGGNKDNMVEEIPRTVKTRQRKT